MALSNLGLIQMGGAMLRPGGSLGDGFLAYGDGMVRDDQMKTTALYRNAQMQALQSQAQERQMKILADQQQKENMKQFMASLQAPQSAPAQASPQSGLNGPLGSGTFGIDPLAAMAEKGLQTPAQASATPQGKSQWDAMKVLMGMQAGLKREDIEALANARNLGRDEVARVIDGQDDLGRPVQYRESKFGDRIGSGVAKPYEKQFKDTGGAIQAVDPYTSGFVGTQMPKTNSPDSLLSAQTTRRGQNMTDARAREFNTNTAAATQATRDATQAGKRWDDLSGLRKEFAALPEVKNFKEIIPAQQSATDAIKRDTAQADINLVYATAKIFDPTSVVREGEYATVSSSAPPLERYTGLVNHLLGGGKLTPQTRAALLAEINSRAAAAEGAYSAARDSYSGIVDRSGFKPEDVFPELPKLAQPKADDKSFKMPSTSDIDAAIARKLQFQDGRGR